MIRWVTALLLTLATAPSSGLQPDIAKALTRQLKFSPVDLTDLQRGKVVKHGVESAAPGEIAVVGAVRVGVPAALLLERVRAIAQFKQGPDVLQIGRFSDPPVPGDLDGLTVMRDDFDAARCHVADCGIRLPAEAIRRLPSEVNPSGLGSQERAARWFKRMLFDHVRAYWSGGAGRMASYDDDSQPIHPIDEFNSLMKNAPMLEALAPALHAHLLNFPSNRMAGAEDFLYWSKEKFGIAPFITVTHVTIACQPEGTCLVTSKDVYSSRYIDASVAVTIASADAADPKAFYLIYVNRSRANALKGRFSGLRRAIAERRARASLETTLTSLKNRLEAAR